MGGRRSAGFAVLLAALIGLVPAPLRAGEPVSFTLHDFQFEDGPVLPELRIAYETYGTLSPARDNAIVLLHDAGGDRHAFEPLIGPGKLFDTDRYFVVAADALGGGDSSSPADGAGQDFPRYGVRDMMEAEHALVTEGLGLREVHAVVGRSMGAFVALEWAIHHPGLIRRLALIGPAVRTEASLDLIVDLIASVIALDPEWQGGRYARNPVEGLRRAGMLYYPWSVTASYLDRISPHALGQELEAAAQSFAAWDANSLVWRLSACRGFDVTGPFYGDLAAALTPVTMPVLLLPIASDRLYGPSVARRLRDGLARASYAEIPSDLGHRAVDLPPDTAAAAQIERLVRDFIAPPK